MKRIFLCTLVVLALSSLAIPGRSQSQSAASATSSPQAPPATGVNPPKVWTNDDVDGLRSTETVSVVGKLPGANAKKTGAPSQPPSGEKDPAWYRKQLIPLQADVAKLDIQIEKLQDFIAGKNVSEAQPYRHGPAGNPRDQLSQFEKKRQAEAAKIDDLLDLARHNGIQPGALR